MSVRAAEPIERGCPIREWLGTLDTREVRFVTVDPADFGQSGDIHGGSKFAVFRLDYLSCCLTVLSTVLVGQKRWFGLAVAGINSAIICVIGLKTGQLGFIPANLFCIGVYVFSIRSWVKSNSSV